MARSPRSTARRSAGRRSAGRRSTARRSTARRSAGRPPAEPESSYERIYDVVRRIPRGKVATYGQVAALAGLPGHARQAGYALHALRDDSVPWQRVINTRGEISARSEPGSEPLQRLMLEDEGVVFDHRGRVDLKRFRWDPA